MANDGKTMSDLFLSLMQGLDDDDEKKKRGFIPGTSIPMPDPNSLIPPVLDQFQTPPPKVPYQDAGDYMAAYREANKDRLPSQTPTPPQVYKLDEGMPIPGYNVDSPDPKVSMEVPTFQGPVPEPYQDAGEYMAAYREANKKAIDAIPSVQEVPKPVEVDTSALEAFRSDLIGKDPSSYIPKPTSAYDPVANREATQALVDQNTANRAIQQAAYDANKQQRIADADISQYIPSSIPSAQRMGKELSLQLGVPSKILEEAGKGVGNLALKGVEAIGDPVVRFGQGFMGSEPTGIESGSLGRYYINDPYRPFSDSPSDVPPESDIPVLPDQEVKPVPKDAKGTPVVTAADVDKSASDLGDKAGDVDTAVNASGVKPGGTVVTTTNTDTGEEKVVVVDEEGNEKPGFLKGLWNGIKDIAKEGFEDPTMRKALFAYTASKVLGYDGVTLAAGVLENEWQKQAAQAKADLELEKAYGKTQAEAIKNQRMDYTTSKTMYDPKAKKNYAGFMNKTGDFEFGEEVVLPYPNDKNEMVMTKFPAGSTLPVNVLTKLGYSVGQGKSMAELQDKYLQFAQDRATAVIGQIKDRNSSMESKQLDDLVAQMQAATDPNILSEPLMTFLSTLPAGADPTDKFVKEAAVNGIREWLKSFESGQTVGSKDLVGFLDAQRMKLDITSNGIPQVYFKIPADKKGEAQVGNNALSMIMNGIESSPYAKDLGLSTPIILSKMSDIYGKKVINEKGFQSRMNGYSKDSFSAGDKSKFVSPFFAFVEKSFSSDNNDIAELMAELKK